MHRIKETDSLFLKDEVFFWKMVTRVPWWTPGTLHCLPASLDGRVSVNIEHNSYANFDICVISQNSSTKSL